MLSRPTSLTLVLLAFVLCLACDGKHKGGEASVTFGQRANLEPGTKMRIEGKTSLEIKTGDTYNVRTSVSFKTGYAIVGAESGMLTVVSAEQSEQLGDAAPVVASIENVEIAVERSSRALTPRDGASLPKGIKLVLQGAVGSPTLRELRNSLLAGKTLAVDAWQSIPTDIFAETPYAGRGFEGGRFRVIEPTSKSALLHIEVSGPTKTMELRVTVLRDTLRATRGSVRSRVEAAVAGKTEVRLVESSYENHFL